ncbi:hypothetical protein B7463_g7897, partial [Scytalidium lignicola]
MEKWSTNDADIEKGLEEVEDNNDNDEDDDIETVVSEEEEEDDMEDFIADERFGVIVIDNRVFSIENPIIRTVWS